MHRAWFTSLLDNLFGQWAQWPFVRFDFMAGDTFGAFARFVNENQRAFVLNTDAINGLVPKVGSVEAPNNYVLTAKLVAANPAICMQAEWPANAAGQVDLRPAGSCRK